MKDFFKYYAQNRHKATTLTPAYHAGVFLLCWVQSACLHCQAMAWAWCSGHAFSIQSGCCPQHVLLKAWMQSMW